MSETGRQPLRGDFHRAREAGIAAYLAVMTCPRPAPDPIHARRSPPRPSRNPVVMRSNSLTLQEGTDTMTTDAPILPSTPEGLRAALDAAGVIYPRDWDDAQLRKAIADDPSIVDPSIPPVRVAMPDAPADLEAQMVAKVATFAQSIAQSTVDAVWQAGWRPQDAPAPEPAGRYKARLAGPGELVITSMPRRITTRTIVRDAQDRISGVVDIEEDAP